MLGFCQCARLMRYSVLMRGEAFAYAALMSAI